MRYMALDLGDRYIGIALSDTLGMIARPLTVIRRTSRINDFNRYKELITEHQVQAIIVGLPYNMDGSEGRQAQWVRDYMAAFAQMVDLPIHLVDERLTTQEASEIMIQTGRQPNKDEIDAVAAAVILQSYLDTHRHGYRQ
jgi:putative Holliday junction resolvase